MILVIFGAGASYDSVPSRPPHLYGRRDIPNRPPLAAELFWPDERVFADNLAYFPECHPVVPYLQATKGGSIEQRLETLQSEGANDPERKRQIAAIRYYLHVAIWQCEQRWSDDVARGITNYATLLDQLRRVKRNDEPVLLVNFNYDRLVERALTSVGITISSLPDYIGHDNFKLIKVHGSVHWAREVGTELENVKNRNVWELARELINRASELNITNKYRMIGDSHPISKIDDTPLFPAIAIPVESKSEFECPPDHLDSLSGLLTKVDRVLCVGWRASEEHFLSLLRNSPNRTVPCQVVTGSNDADKVLAHIIEKGCADPGLSSARDVGFTEYAVSREAEQFLK